MNNSQFRRLLDIPTTTSNNGLAANATPKPDRSMATSLGSRMRPSIPMTP